MVPLSHSRYAYLLNLWVSLGHVWHALASKQMFHTSVTYAMQHHNLLQLRENVVQLLDIATSVAPCVWLRLSFVRNPVSV